MKRRDLLHRLVDEGCVLVRHGAGHDLYRNVITGKMEAVPRHAELKEISESRAGRIGHIPCGTAP